MNDSNSPRLEDSIKSEEVTEVLERPSNWILNSGIAILFGFFIVILFGSSLVPYPEYIEGEVQVISHNEPVSIYPQSTGQITKIMVEDEEYKEIGDPLFVVGSNLDNKYLRELEASLVVLKDASLNDLKSEIDSILFKTKWDLQEMTGQFKMLKESVIFFSNHFLEKQFLDEMRSLDLELNLLNEIDSNLRIQKKVLIQVYELSKDEFELTQQEHEQNLISTVQYNQAYQKFLQAKLPLLSIEKGLLDNKLLLGLKEREVVNQKAEMEIEYQKFLNSVNNMIESIREWEEKHLIKAPFSGTVKFYNEIKTYQYIQSREEPIVYIQSDSSIPLFEGIATFSENRLSELSLGQQVTVSVNGFSESKYGKLTGSVSSISQIFDEKSLFVKIQMPNGMTTTRGLAINYIAGMSGKAQVIIDNKSLFDKLFENIWKISF
ncbi:HlyD family efflux transporter periplasmic adaptor subunit [Roseivirga pacifica]|uniref:HlyD family efflux transporter periplasmic adaptor subunit n=1 Tax=Roseivirga pacifica TaxID=1267423 RepID=UPI00227CB106|nr:HlyD family efflux transporter periplasmic adaptor subunit [Roseivirga pacifica]